MATATRGSRALRRWRGHIDVIMRQHHKAGEKLFVDWAGDTLPVIDPDTGELGRGPSSSWRSSASRTTFGAATRRRECSTGTAHVRGLELGAAARGPRARQPEDRREEAGPLRGRGLRHLRRARRPLRLRGAAGARPKPRDKAKVEVGVQIAERGIIAPLRKRTFFSLAEANAAIAAPTRDLNTRPFAKLPGSRASVFERRGATAAALARDPMPRRTAKASVHIDYHVEVDTYYSVPYQLAREQVEVRFDARTVEVFSSRGGGVALRSCAAGPPPARRTCPSAPPARLLDARAHRGLGGQDGAGDGCPLARSWPLARTPSWAFGRVSASCASADVTGERLARRPPLGRLRSAPPRTAPSRRSSERGLDRMPSPRHTPFPTLAHANVRGASYYD